MEIPLDWFPERMYNLSSWYLMLFGGRAFQVPAEFSPQMFRVQKQDTGKNRK